MRGKDFFFFFFKTVIITRIARYKASPFPPLQDVKSVPPGVFSPVGFGWEKAVAGVSHGTCPGGVWGWSWGGGGDVPDPLGEK